MHYLHGNCGLDSASCGVNFSRHSKKVQGFILFSEYWGNEKSSIELQVNCTALSFDKWSWSISTWWSYVLYLIAAPDRILCIDSPSLHISLSQAFLQTSLWSILILIKRGIRTAVKGASHTCHDSWCLLASSLCWSFSAFLLIFSSCLDVNFSWNSTCGKNRLNYMESIILDFNFQITWNVQFSVPHPY